VLRADPDSEDARWNLELVERWLEDEEQGGAPGEGEGGGQGAAGQEAGGEGGTQMTPEEAQRLLEAAADQEREVQARRLERNRERDPSLEKNW
jgi:Ca-activated chloride channel family protein